jgi:YbgC/YbaW family acyl-CoA thioester hydrolase
MARIPAASTAGWYLISAVPISEFRYARRVQFAETDLAGMVHFSWYLRYMEEAEHALWREAGLSIVPAGGGVGFPRVAVSCDYLAPLRFEDVFEVHVRIEAISKRSIRYSHTIRRGDTVCATGSMTAVCVQDEPELRAIDIPEAIASRLAPASP